MQSKCNAVGVSRKDPKLASAVVASHFDARWSRILQNQMEGNCFCVQIKTDQAIKYYLDATLGNVTKGYCNQFNS